MNRKFNKPIIQAAIIILVCLFFISFGMATGETTFWGNLKMLISAFFSTITFIIGITIAILLSIIILIGLFLGGMAIYSRPKAQEMSKNVWASATSFGEGAKKLFLKKVDEIEHSEKLQGKKEHLTHQVKDLTTKLANLTEKVKSSSIVTGDTNAQDDSAPSQQTKTSPELDQKVEALSQEMAELRNEFRTFQENVSQQLSAYQTPATAPADDLPPPMHILRYIESDEDKSRFTEFVNETVQQRMSFAKARKYLEKNLPDDLRIHIEEHPRLTKDYIRHQRKELGWT